MNIKKIPQLARDFADGVSNTVRSVSDNVNLHIFRMYASLGSDSTLSSGNRTYHGVKVAALTGLFVLGALSLNPEAVIGVGVALGDEAKYLDEIGTAVLKAHPHHHIT